MFGPILEAIIFREGIHQAIPVNEASLMDRVQRIAKTSIIFGVCHLSPTQGWVNIPILCVTTIMGIVFHLLREVTGDIIDPSAAHITNNSLAMYGYLSTSQ